MGRERSGEAKGDLECRGRGRGGRVGRTKDAWELRGGAVHVVMSVRVTACMSV